MQGATKYEGLGYIFNLASNKFSMIDFCSEVLKF
jgi:hypothetical protein